MLSEEVTQVWNDWEIMMSVKPAFVISAGYLHDLDWESSTAEMQATCRY